MRPRSSRLWSLSTRVFALAAASMLVQGHADAETKPVATFLNFTVLNTNYSTVEYYAGIPLRLRMLGTGKCRMKVIFETRQGSLMYTRDVELSLPTDYTTDYNLPPYGKQGEPNMSRREYRVRVEPVLPSCVGVNRKKDLLTSCAKSKESGSVCKPYVEAKPGDVAPQPSASGTSGSPSLKLTFPAGGGGSSAAPANGKVTSIQVPGGSFAVDEAQKLVVSGQGGCGFDLTISNKSYGGSFENTYDVSPQNLAASPTLYNGTHFATLAEGSYWAKAVGKNGCTGSAQIDFKVTGPVCTGKVSGKPTVSFDKKPLDGVAFSPKKDSNIWFKVALPKNVKDTQYATCCEVELNFKNAYGGWEALPNSPFQDTGFGLAVSQEAAVVPKSVSGYTNAREWRVKMKAYKYKTLFDWSDWVEFKVSPN